MIMRRKYFRSGLFILLFCLIGSIKAEAFPDEAAAAEKGEVVFLLDTSISMNTQDKDRAALEAIRRAMYSLPSDYQAGLVAYNTEIQAMIPLSNRMEALDRQLDLIPYTGYTNAGEGLRQAVGLFSDGEGVERGIFLLTDWEIDMPDQQQKEYSRRLYEEAAAKAAEREIRIYIIAIGSELGNPQMHIFDGAEVTRGAVYWEGQSGTLAEILERILVERMKVPLKEAEVKTETRGAGKPENMAETGGAAEIGEAAEIGGAAEIGEAAEAVKPGNVAGGTILTTEIPQNASRIRLLLTSGGEMKPFSVECQAESQEVILGKSFAMVDLVRPVSDQVRICFHAEGDVGEVSGSVKESGQRENMSQGEYPVRICMLTEYAARIRVEAEYESQELERTEEEIKKKIPPRYDHLAYLVIQAVDQEDGSVCLWDRPDLDGMKLSYILNGEVCRGVIEKGRIRAVIPADEVEEVEVLVDTKGLGDVWQVRQAELVRIEKTPDPVFSPGPDYRLLWGILGILGAVLVCLALWERRRHTTILYMDHARTGDGAEKPLVLQDTPYSGKFNLYLVRTRDGRDFPPQVYRLFGRTPGRISLKQILDACRIYYGERESGDIVFCPGPEHSVILCDRSDQCTVMRGAEILKKGKGYPVYYNEKITITFYEEDTELELYYKNLKPSERENMG